MLNRLKYYWKRHYSLQRINIALARASAASASRQLDETNPLSWEFSGFSQNGGDGIIDFLTRKLLHPNRYFVEIGASHGIENNSSWLAIARNYSGLMVEGDEEACNSIFILLSHGLCIGVEFCKLFVTTKNVDQVMAMALWKNPDVFSLDIDGNDYYVARSLLEQGFRPRIVVVEFNSAFGPRASTTIEYREDFSIFDVDDKRLYYGVSISGWRTLFKKHGYKFLTADSNGVDAFFVDPKEFPKSFITHLRGLQFQENFYQMMRFKAPWNKQYEMIKDKKLARIV